MRVSELATYLTPVESKIVCLIAQGKSNKEIGHLMQYRGDAENCVKPQVSEALRKLALPNRTALALWAHGLWPPPKLDDKQVWERSFRFKERPAA
jgi:DNA-binding NarL/FixJ family response regulator